MKGFTVYYVVGQPRTGSTLVGDRIARRYGIVNAGEVWQTFRSLGLVEQQGFDGSADHWARPDMRAQRNAEISRHPFWSGVIERAHGADCYAALVGEAAAKAPALVDCSKTDQGVERYLTLGCRVIVVQTVRAFSSWARSYQKHMARLDLPQISRLRLIAAYLRLNRRYSGRWREYDLLIVPQENLADLDRMLSALPSPSSEGGQYFSAEMFGTPDFTGQYDQSRATTDITILDRLAYSLIGVGH